MATKAPRDDRERRKRYLNRLSALKSERSSWDATWRELAEYIQPRRSRFFRSERNRGEKKRARIINGTAGWGLRVLTSGMMAGFSSPARPWVRLATADPRLDSSGPVREWMHLAVERVHGALARARIYGTLNLVYRDLGLFGLGCALVDSDPRQLMRGYSIPVGEYALATSARGEVDTLYRETSLTVAQLVEKFGRDACSSRVRDAYDRGSVDEWIDVLHVVEPRREADPARADRLSKPWASCWMECGSDETGFLFEGGYDESPVLAPRWDVTGNDTYGDGPGWACLGDVKALQLLERDKATMVELGATPPLGAPSSLRNGTVSLLPRTTTFLDGPTSKVEPLYQPAPAWIQVVSESIREHEQRIGRDMYADLWLMLSDGQAEPQKTAREIAERHEEKMLQLGPVAIRLEDELFRPLVERTLGLLLRSGELPPAPPELQGQELAIEFVSIMSQALKLVRASGIERLTGYVGQVAQFSPEALDKVDVDAAVSLYADDLDVDPSVIRPDDQVAAIRHQRAQQQAQQAQMQQALQAAQGAKALSQADTGGDNALTRLVGGVAAAQASGGGV